MKKLTTEDRRWLALAIVACVFFMGLTQFLES
jgi:hypothetical protein